MIAGGTGHIVSIGKKEESRGIGTVKEEIFDTVACVMDINVCSK